MKLLQSYSTYISSSVAIPYHTVRKCYTQNPMLLSLYFYDHTSVKKFWPVFLYEIKLKF